MYFRWQPHTHLKFALPSVSGQVETVAGSTPKDTTPPRIVRFRGQWEEAMRDDAHRRLLQGGHLGPSLRGGSASGRSKTAGAVNGARTVVTEVAQSATPILTTSVSRCANNDCPTKPALAPGGGAASIVGPPVSASRHQRSAPVAVAEMN